MPQRQEGRTQDVPGVGSDPVRKVKGGLGEEMNTNWDAKWSSIVAALQEFADAERRGYQIIFLADSEDHHEEVVAQILPAGVKEYDPEKGLYSDGK